MIILLSVILHYVHCCHHNQNKCKHDARPCVVCECWIYDKSIHSSFLSWRDRYLKKIKDQSQNPQNRRFGEKANHIYATYKRTVIPHGRHIYAKESHMAQATMCAYNQSYHTLPHWKCVLRCCADCPCINITEQETGNKYSGKTSSIRFHIYHIIARFSAHVRIPLKDKKMCYMCKQEYSSDKSTKIYTRKYSVMMETAISDFHTSFYIPSIQNLAFHLPHVRILGTNHCGEMRRTAFKQHELFQDVLCCRDYAERVVASFSNKIKS